jgi:hypothetical protein
MLTKTERRVKRKGIEKVQLVRAANIRLLIGHYKTQSALAQLLAVSDSYLTQIAGIAPVRSLGEAAARDIEGKLGLPSGWLDMSR